MWPDRVSNSGPLALESDRLPAALCSPASFHLTDCCSKYYFSHVETLPSKYVGPLTPPEINDTQVLLLQKHQAAHLFGVGPNG